jgi:hypothetical protein
MVTTENKKQKIDGIVASFSTVGIFLFALYLYIKSPQWLGGSEIFFFIAGLGIFFSKKVKALQVDINLLIQAVLLLMIFNYFAAMEYVKGLNETSMIASSIILVLASIVTAIAVRRPLGASSEDSAELKRDVRRRVLPLVDSGIIAITLGYTVVTIALFSAISHEGFINSFRIKFSTLILLCFIGALCVSFMRGRRVQDAYINFLVTKKLKGDIAQINKWGKYLLVGTFALGTLVETIRGLWTTWLLSWTAFLMIVLTTWRTWKYFFVESTVNQNSLDSKSLPNSFGIRTLIKYVGINFVVICIYFFGIILFWYFFWSR